MEKTIKDMKQYNKFAYSNFIIGLWSIFMAYMAGMYLGGNTNGVIFSIVLIIVSIGFTVWNSLKFFERVEELTHAVEFYEERIPVIGEKPIDWEKHQHYEHDIPKKLNVGEVPSFNRDNIMPSYEPKKAL